MRINDQGKSSYRFSISTVTSLIIMYAYLKQIKKQKINYQGQLEIEGGVNEGGTVFISMPCSGDSGNKFLELDVYEFMSPEETFSFFLDCPDRSYPISLDLITVLPVPYQSVSKERNHITLNIPRKIENNLYFQLYSFKSNRGNLN